MSLGGSIAFVISVSACIGNPGTSGSTAINGALGAMVLPLAHDFGPIRVNAVSSGVVDTGWWEGHPAETKRRVFERIASSVPIKRVGRPEDVADATVFLAGSGYITGVILDVDGGMRSAAIPG